MKKRNTTIIAVCNHKGGVGKTTTTISIGAGLANRGYKVLLVDMDAQANLTDSLQVADTTANTYLMMTGEKGLQPFPLSGNLHVMPAVLDLAGIEADLLQQKGKEFLLENALATMRGEYDYILIDTAPSFGLLTMNALVAADSLIIPMQAEYLALKGIAKITEVMTAVKAASNTRLHVCGVVLTRYDNRIILNRQVMEAVRSQFGAVVLPPVRTNIALAEAPAMGVDIFRYAPDSTGARDYNAVVDALLERLRES